MFAVENVPVFKGGGVSPRSAGGQFLDSAGSAFESGARSSAAQGPTLTRAPGSSLLSLSLNEPVGEAQVRQLEGGLALGVVSRRQD